MTARRVDPDVCEIEVEGDEDSIFRGAGVQDDRIDAPASPSDTAVSTSWPRSRNAGSARRGKFSSSLKRRLIKLRYAGTGTIRSLARSAA